MAEMTQATDRPATDRPAWPFDAVRHRAVADRCRLRDPDLFFASQFMGKRRRHAVYVVWAVLDQLRQIMTSKDEGGCAGCSGSGSGACGSMNKPPTPGMDDERVKVCAAVLDYLLGGEKTGEAHLDGFAEIINHAGIGRARFDEYVQGLAELQALKRVATWSRLRAALEKAAGAPAAIVADMFTDDYPDDRRARLTAWATAPALLELLCDTASIWRCGARLLIPLDDLVKCRLTEKDIAGFTEKQTAGGDERWRAMAQLQSERIANLRAGGLAGLDPLPTDVRRAALVYAEIRMIRLSDLADPFAASRPITTWQRVRRVMPAIRLMR